MKKHAIYTLLLVGTVLAGCGGSKSITNLNVDAVKQHYANMAYAVYQDAYQDALALQAQVDYLLNDPTEINLTATRDAYKQSRVSYQQSEIMRWDTAITLGQTLADDGGPESVDAWEGQVNAWPLDEHHIDSIIAGDEPITRERLIAQSGAQGNEANVTTGVHAVEYLLWGPDDNGTAAGAGQRQANAFLASDCSDSLCQRRAQYLKVVTDLLVDDLAEMTQEWRPQALSQEGTLAYNFVTHDQALDYMLGALRSMASDELASARMGSGLTLGDPEEEHDCFSDLSHVAIYYNFVGVRNGFYGQYHALQGPSIADLIKARDSTLYQDIDQALTDIDVTMKAIYDAGERTDNPIKFDQIIGQTNNAQERQWALEAVQKLIALDGQFEAARLLLSLDLLEGGADGD